jgi:serine/threonine protein kinase
MKSAGGFMQAQRSRHRENPSTEGTGSLESGSRPRSEVSLPAPGDNIGGKYDITRILGSGAMGVVYEAIHTRLHQRLAIKVLRPDVKEFHAVVERFEREAHATARLRSVHAARVIDVDALPNGLPYIVMEYLEGRGLDAELGAVGPMPVETAVDIVSQVAQAMIEAHSLGIIHRDLKPANVFVCRVGGRAVAKVLDFGISKVEDESRLTGAGEWFGTPSYSSPEQMQAVVEADARCDVWSLGVILFELLTGRVPFEGTTVQVITQVLMNPVPWPVTLRPDLPPGLARAVMKALERDREKRFQSMREMADALAPFGPTQSATSVLGELQRSRGRLGEILVNDGLITRADLDRALAAQRTEGGLLGKVLLDLGLVTHADLLTAVAKQQGLPTADTQRNLLDRERRDREAETISPPGALAPSPQAHPSRSRWVVAGVIAIAIAAAFVLGRSYGASGSAAGHPAATSQGVAR